MATLAQNIPVTTPTGQTVYVSGTPESIGSAASAAATGFSGTSFGLPTQRASSAITPSSLTPATPAAIPSPAAPTGAGSLAGNNAGLAGLLAPLGYTLNASGVFEYKAPTTAPVTVQPTQISELFKQYLGAQAPPPSVADQFTRLQADAGIQQKQQAVQSYTNRLNTIIASAQAQNLALEGQGRGQTTGFIGGEQARINREAAIQALPIQAQLAASQGDLQLAQTHVETMFKVLSQDAQNQYEFKTRLVDSIFNFATKEQQGQLDALKQEKQNKFTIQQNNLNYAEKLANTALENGQRTLGGKIIALDSNSSTYRQDLANLASQIALPQEAGAGVVTAGISPVTNKPFTEIQSKSSTFAIRMEQAEAGLKSKSFRDIALFGLQALKSNERRQFEQASKNFVTAVLRKESGAAIGKSEFDDAALIYIPQFGDDAMTLEQKAEARRIAFQGMIRDSAGAYEQARGTTTSTQTIPTQTRSGKSFNYQAAKSAGYSDAEIMAYLNGN